MLAAHRGEPTGGEAGAGEGAAVADDQPSKRFATVTKQDRHKLPHRPFAGLAGKLRSRGEAPRSGSSPADQAGGEPQSFEDGWTAGAGAAQPLPAGPARVPPAPPPTPAGEGSSPPPQPAEPTFTITEQDGWLSGWREDVGASVLAQLRGRPAVDAQLDLHGLDVRQARLAVRKLIRAKAGRARLLLIIHGKGRHSEAGLGTLRTALPAWLCEPPLGRLVRAFGTAGRADGGTGALYVLLNPPRSRR